MNSADSAPCGKVSDNTFGMPCRLRQGHRGTHHRPAPVYGKRGVTGYVIERWSAESYTVEWCERTDWQELSTRLLGSYSTKAQALAGMRRMKAMGIRR